MLNWDKKRQKKTCKPKVYRHNNHMRKRAVGGELEPTFFNNAVIVKLSMKPFTVLTFADMKI